MKIKGIKLQFDKEMCRSLWKVVKVLLDPVLNLLFGAAPVYLLYRLAMWIHHCVVNSALLTQMAEQGGFSSNWSVIIMMVAEQVAALVVLAANTIIVVLALVLVWLFGARLRRKVSDAIRAFVAWHNIVK